MSDREAILKAIQEEIAMQKADGQGVQSRSVSDIKAGTDTTSKKNISLDKKGKTVGGDTGGETGGNKAPANPDKPLEEPDGNPIQKSDPDECGCFSGTEHTSGPGDSGAKTKPTEKMDQMGGEGVASRKVGKVKIKGGGSKVSMDNKGGKSVQSKEMSDKSSMVKEDSWPEDLEEGRFTEYCKEQGFDEPCIECAKLALDSDDPSVRGMASFYMNTVQPKGKDAGDIKTEKKIITLPHDVMVERDGKTETLKGGTQVVVEMYDDGTTPEPDFDISNVDEIAIEPVEPEIDTVEPEIGTVEPEIDTPYDEDMITKIVTAVISALQNDDAIMPDAEVDVDGLRESISKIVTYNETKFGNAVTEGNEVEDLDSSETDKEISDYEKEEHDIDITDPSAIACLLDDAIADLEEVREFVGSDDEDMEYDDEDMEYDDMEYDDDDDDDMEYDDDEEEGLEDDEFAEAGKYC